MPDAIFAEPRLARLYDVFDGGRDDLEAYRALVGEFGARSVLDLGCGTGSLAVLLAADGIEVTGVDPAAASLGVARGKPGADRVRWLEGDAGMLPELDPPVRVELAVMTGNVAQVFLDDTDWRSTLAAVRSVLVPGGRLVFESRRPEVRDWETWGGDSRDEMREEVREVPGEGTVRERFRLTDVAEPFIGFESRFLFPDGTELTSSSRLRFRGAAEIGADLAATGFDLVEIREAPDRPGLENVFVCRVPAGR